MKKYLIVNIVIIVLITVTASSCHGHMSTIKETESPIVTPASSIPTSQNETSKDIGAHFDKSVVQLKYVSFTPVITKSEAIAIAKKRLHDGFGWDTDNLEADATVALFCGPSHSTSTRSAGIVNDV